MSADEHTTDNLQSRPLRQFTLNRIFYNHKPQDYFWQRLSLVRSMLDSDEGSIETRMHVAIELEMLKFHGIETMLRYFVGHELAPERPWQKVSGLERRAAPTEDLKAIWEVGRTDRLELVSRLLFGVTDEREIPRSLDSVWNERLEGAEAFVSHYISYYADLSGRHQRHRERETYNAAKHGMTLAAVRLNELGLDNDPDAIGLAHLQYESARNVDLWRIRVVWTDPEVVMLETFLAIALLEQVWDVGRRKFGLSPGTAEAINEVEWSPGLFAELHDLLEARSGVVIAEVDLVEE